MRMAAPHPLRGLRPLSTLSPLRGERESGVRGSHIAHLHHPNSAHAPSRSRGTFRARVLRVAAPPKSEGGAGRRGPDGPAGLRLSRDASGAMLFDEAPLGLVVRKSAISPASRARCLKPLCPTPGGLTVSGFRPHRRGSLSTASGASTCLGGWHRRYDMPPRAPGGARLARRDRSASAVATRMCVLHPFATTAPDPHSKTPLEAPLVDRGTCIIGEVLRAGINYFREVIPARSPHERSDMRDRQGR